MTAHPAPLAILVSDSRTPCGVEAFARRLAVEAGSATRTPVLSFDTAGLLRAAAGCRALVVNLPVVAWKRRLLEPLLALRAARRAGLPVVLVLHEWADLDWKRRLAFRPLLALADRILFSSPEIAAQYAGAAGRAGAGLVPIPPNVDRPAATEASEARARLAAEHRRGRLILGQFGSIYPRKQPTAVLEVAAELVRRGADPFVVFVGSFIGAAVQASFEAETARLGLGDRVLVTGYVASEAALFGLFDEVDVFAYRFAEGLTARRGSVFACLVSGAPVVVNAPGHAGAFDHHPAYRAALAAGQLTFVPTGADAAAFAEAVLAARARGRTAAPPDVPSAWGDALAAVEAALHP